MTRLPDLVRDSRLETHFLPDCSVETVHTYNESDATSRRRVVARSEHWKRRRRIGGGGYSTVWLEECAQGSRCDIQVRAVKQIETGGRFHRIDFNRELETIAKFSHSRNILIKSHPPDEWWIKIADFGISKRIEESPETSTTLRGTTGFIAPELYGFLEPGSPYAADIWSLGEITFQMLTKAPAFKPIGRLSSYTTQPEIFPASLLDEAGVSKLGIEFVRSLMRPVPDSRLTSEMAILHPWVKPLSQIPLLPRAEALFQPTPMAQEVSPGGNDTCAAIEEITEELSTIHPPEITPKGNSDQSSGAKQPPTPNDDMEERVGENDLTRSQSSLARGPKALSVSSENSKTSSSQATSIPSQHSPPSDRLTEEWWTDHLRHAGLLSTTSNESATGASPKKGASVLRGIFAKPKRVPEVEGEKELTRVKPLCPGSGMKDVGASHNQSFLEDPISPPELKPNTPEDESKLHRPGTSLNKKSDVRCLADTLMPSLSLDGSLSRGISGPGPSIRVRPTLPVSRSADDANLEACHFSRSRMSELEHRTRLEAELCSWLPSSPLARNRTRSQTVDESRDPNRGIVALPLIESDDEKHGRPPSQAGKGGSGSRSGVVNRIVAGFGFGNGDNEKGKGSSCSHGGFRFRFTLPLEAKRHRQISLCPHNLRLVTASGNPTGVEVWSIPKRCRISTETIFRSNSCIAMSHGGTLFASTSGDCLTVWSSFDGSSTAITSTEGLKNPQFSHDGTLLAAMSRQKKIHIWQVFDHHNLQLQKLNTLHLDDSALAFAFQSRSRRVVVALNNAIRVLGIYSDQDDIDGTYQFDLSVLGRSFKPKRVDMERGLVTALSENGRMAAQAYPDGLIGSILFIRDLKWKADKRSRKFVVSPIIQTMTFSSTGEILAASTKGRDIILWDVLQGKQILRLENCHETSITCMFLADEGELLATCSSGEGIKFWGTDESMDRLAERTM
ncbi:hypothetical protein N7481_008679 [Penicillium waksmanii]|uniref:uncharacterized protein n=1 Tax=Penicillium waksmanii TaxID=69791 RepID=UPI002547F693|nr:uncharacterized protein N7481_008679 [Penicillium waksmanii]KAJ5974972.1 hypothetical protein N7481_008679 [Penicillium waksmanii]